MGDGLPTAHKRDSNSSSPPRAPDPARSASPTHRRRPEQRGAPLGSELLVAAAGAAEYEGAGEGAVVEKRKMGRSFGMSRTEESGEEQ